MRIAVATVYGVLGGSTKVLLTASGALRVEHEVVVRSPSHIADSRAPHGLSESALDTWSRKLGAIPALVRIFASEWSFSRSWQPDIFYVHDEPSLYVYGLIGRLRGIRVVWHVHMREGRGWRRILRNALCDAKLFVSWALILSPQNKPWAVVANPVAVGSVARKTESNERVVGMLGSISTLKNQELGLRVVAELRRREVPVRLVIFGNILDADYRERLAQLIRCLGLCDVVEFRGFVPTEKALTEIDVLLTCSVYESFGLAVAEALAAGIPVVATDIEAHREFLLSGPSSALAVCAADPVELADSVMAARPDEGLSKCIREKFSQEHFVAAISDFFEELSQVWFRRATTQNSLCRCLRKQRL